MIAQKISDTELLTETTKRLTPTQIANKYKMNRCGIYTRKKRLGLTIPRMKPILESSKKLTPEKAYILGVVATDGYLSFEAIEFSSADKEFIDEFERCIEFVYGLKCKRYVLTGQEHITRICLYSVKVAEDLKKYGSFRTKNWRIPVEIKEASQEIKSKYLRSLFDSEANVETTYNIRLHSTNIEALKEVQLLLKDFNIESRITIREYSADFLSITKKCNLERFNQKIGFTINRKRKMLEYLINRFMKDYSYNRHPLELIIKEYLDGKGIMELCNKYNITPADLYSAMNRRSIVYRHNPRKAKK